VRDATTVTMMSGFQATLRDSKRPASADPAVIQ
jgi:hypothetical protein